MSKLQRKAAVEQAKAEGLTNGMRDQQLTANGIDRAAADDIVEELQRREDEARAQINNSMAKIMTNEETPRCPFCKSVKLEEMPPQNWLRWRCNDCRKHFRAPVKGRAA